MTVFKYFLMFFLSGFYVNGICQTPEVTIESVNSGTVGIYEKFEIHAGLDNVSYTNPYDPDQVDLRAHFTSPSGREWSIFGFYDDYQNKKQWKVRFGPNEIGQWHYFLSLKTVTGEAQSTVETFDVNNSNYHGWIRVSPVNPHYFIHDDGTPFYGVGPYYPWQVNNGSSGLGLLEESGCNFWGYWNIMYDTGEIIESMNSGLGRYDQPKCGRIDQLITWSEERNLKMMLAIWPHDLLSNTVWAHQWHQNPYNTICSVEEFYESDIAWEYQEKQYRYIIARWGYSRALAVWEIINEINGTDGWVAGKEEEARIWVGRVHDYLTLNDPHQRPTTASMSGGHYWPEGYAEVDIPNVHVYETGWSAKYLGNPLRSSLYTYHMLANQFWNDFEKPAIFGEAGYTNSYGNFAAGSDEYTAMFHNALWASWAGGMAVTPVWWSLGSKQLMTPDVMEQMQRFSEIARDYNYAYQNFQPYDVDAEGCDVYAMRSDSSIFAWVRDIYGNSLKGHTLRFRALEDTSYEIVWYNTWTAEIIGRSYIVGVDSLVTIPVPETANKTPDAALFMEESEEGKIPVQIKLGSATTKIYVKRNEQSRILCTIHDAEGRFVRSAENQIKFVIEGPGRFTGPDLMNAETGMAQISFTDDSSSGIARIIASSPGLKSDTLNIEVTNKIRIDDFEGYESKRDLEYIWLIRSGTSADISLVDNMTEEYGTSLMVNYVTGDGHAPYAGVYRFTTEDFSMSEYLEFFLKADASNRTLAILIFEPNGHYWRYDHVLSKNEPELIRIPINSFEPGDTASAINMNQISEISFNILQGAGELGQGTIYLDDINFVIPAIETGIQKGGDKIVPSKFSLMQNYPNPFNNRTVLNYTLQNDCDVKLILYNVLGHRVKTLVDKNQHAGTYHVRFDATGLATGVYYYRLSAGDHEQTKKMLLLR